MQWKAFDPNEELQHGDIRLVPMDTFLKNLASSVDISTDAYDEWCCTDCNGDIDNWSPSDSSDLIDNLLRTKTKNESFWGLCEAIPRKGFTMPVCIRLDGDLWDLGNGHHRTAAAIMLALNEIPVAFSTDSDYILYGITTDDADNSSGSVGDYIGWEALGALYNTLWDI